MFKPQSSYHHSLEAIENHSEEVQAIISYVPRWIVRWGITTLFGVVIAFLVVAWITRYPDIITSRIIILSKNPPIRLIAHSSGRLLTLAVQDRAIVHPDSLLAILENAADTRDVLLLKSAIKEFQIVFLHSSSVAAPPIKIPVWTFSPSPHLGELQSDYTAFIQSYNYYKQFFTFSFRYNQKRLGELNNQIRSYHEAAVKLQNQYSIAIREEEIGQAKYNKDIGLSAKKYLSDTELAASEKSYLSAKSVTENANLASINNEIQIATFRRIRTELEQQTEERKNEVILNLKESINRLQTALATWEYKYCIKSPVHGKVALSKFWSPNQYITANEEVLTVIPGEQHIIGKISLPLMGSGKVAIGQSVNIKLDSYPYNEYGSVEAIIENISLVAKDNQYTLTVSFPYSSNIGLYTNYHKRLIFKEEMQGTAEIVTENIRLLERLFQPFRYMFTNSLSTH